MDFKASVKAKLLSFPTLETSRLILRNFKPEDFDGIFRMRNNFRVGQFMSSQGIASAEDVQALIERVRSMSDNGEGIGWAGFRKGETENSFIGSCGFHRIDFENRRAEIGGEMNTTGWGKFYSFEAVQAIVDFGLSELGFHTIEAKVWPENRSAIYVLDKLGFVKEAHFRDYFMFKGEYRDLAVYTRHADQGQILSGKQEI